jgi:hypothetical protein
MIHIIDGNNMLHRKMWDAPNKMGIHPLREIYLRLMNASKNTIIVWDGLHSRKRRRDLYPGYKQRAEKTEDITASFDIIKEILCHCNVTQIEIPYWEADDVIYTLAIDYTEAKQEVIIETNDQDFWQLADNPLINLPLVKALPCNPAETCIYKALVGDISDTIPGWRGFGPTIWTQMEEHVYEIGDCLENKDWTSWQDIPWPKRLAVTEESFFQCCIYFQVVTMLSVPEAEFEGNYICGKPNPALAEEILARWRI